MATSDSRIESISILRERRHPLLASRTLEWALEEAVRRLEAAGIACAVTDPSESPAAGDTAATLRVELLPSALLGDRAGAALAPLGQESFALFRENDEENGDRPRLVLSASDDVGFLYGLLEFADRVGDAHSELAALLRSVDQPLVERPTVPVRGIVRAFSSPVEDLPWFLDREFWVEYLGFLSASRINRFQLALGMSYNYGLDKAGATDNYLCFAYPFLLDVDGYDVRAEGVDAAEQHRNLEALRFISSEASRRGIHFQLGLWNHAYDYGPASTPPYPITGLTPETHADYSAKALAKLLDECPDIKGLTLRVHYEGGIHDEGHEVYWDRVFTAVSELGRPIEIDMHAKGVDDALLDAVKKPDLDAVLSAKYWAEHLGLPYHQASIRDRELNRPVPPGEEMKAITEFSRRFTRYGYADYLSEDRTIGIVYRVWPGTQKLLLWGDPVIAAGYGRLATFGGSRGVELCEPLFFKGRKGSGEAGKREPYQRPDLQLGGQEWRKYRYGYLLWGRLLYDPDADPVTWRRHLGSVYGAAADAAERALASLSRILPLVTVAHGVGGSNTAYWPEMYHNLPLSPRIVDNEYNDVPPPKIWGRVSSFDPELFYGIDEYASELVEGALSARYTPDEIADWIDRLVAAGEEGLAEFESLAEPSDPQSERTRIDLAMLAGLGRFYSGKFRAASDYAVFRVTGDAPSLRSAIEHYRGAADAFGRVAEIAAGVYQDDIKFGIGPSEHGHWADRLPSLEADIQALQQELDEAPDGTGPAAGSTRRSSRTRQPESAHTAPASYERGEPLELTLRLPQQADDPLLHYRHVDHSETFKTIPLAGDGATGLSASIDGEFTASSYPIMYYFTFTDEAGDRQFHPGLDSETLSNQPYFTVGSTVSPGHW